ncbi:MAG: LamG domain-containing protein, partial [Planctomycetota bacterium]
PTPRPRTDDVCPDVELTWNPGVFVTTHRVYFGSDFPETLPLFEDGFESGFEPNWTSVGWEWFDANAVDPNLRSGGDYSAKAAGAGVKTLTSGDIDATEAGAMEVEFSVRKTEEQLQFGELELYYYNGISYDFVADLNKPGFGPNDVWLHYTDDVNESQYMISNFRIQLRANISTGDEIYVDGASVTNTWVLSPIWFRGEQSAGENSYDPCGLLDFNETYYWRVDEVNEANQPDPWQGRYWSFTTELGKASDPSPLDGQWSLPTDANLSWSPACLGRFQDIYFGTDFNDVNSATDPNSGCGQGRWDANDPNNLVFDPCGLEVYTRYYWRVDQVGESTFVKGDVWTFHTIGGMLFYFDFEGVLDANIIGPDPCDEQQLADSTGSVTFEIEGNHNFLRYAEPNPLWNPDGTSADLASKKIEDDDRVGLYRGEFSRPRVRGPDITDLAAPAYTIEMWVMPEDLGPFYGEEDELITSIGLFRKWKRSYVVDINDSGVVRFTHNGSSTIESADPNDQLKEGPWYHIAAVFDSNDPVNPQKLYIDSLLVASGGTTATNPLDDDDPVSIGLTIQPAWDTPDGYENNSGWFEGRIDELRVFDVALPPERFAFRSNFGLAWYPTPRDREKEVYRHVDFEWKPGDYADHHEVFFGESWEDVNSMTDPCATKTLGQEIWDPGPLDLDYTYYWRVDEVNDTNDYTWKGDIWKFTTADYNVIDDFELYNLTTNQIRDTWRDYWWQALNPPFEPTGGVVDLGVDPYTKVHNGEQSMKYQYNNTLWPDGYSYFCYSEVWLPIPAAKRDWTIVGVKALTLYFYGFPDNDTNDTEQMYLGVEDGDGKYAEVRYGDYAAFEDVNDLKTPEWQAWNIEMAHFNDSNHAAVPNDVNLANIVTLYLGFGNRRTPLTGCGGEGMVLFDDIRLYMPRCVPEYGPVGDYSGDCIVGLEDIEMMGDYWVRSDHNYVGMMQEPSLTGLVGWWKLDGNADDSSSYAHDGNMENYFMWAKDRDGVANSAVKFLLGKDSEDRSTGGRVLIPDAAHLKPINNLSVSAWINLEDTEGSGKIVVKGGKDREAYVLEAEDDELQFFIRDQNSSWKPEERFERYTLDHNRPFPLNEWIHVAGTYDGNEMRLYESGQMLTTSQ